MHKHFADWHRTAGIEPNSETSPKHWGVIDEYRPEVEEIISFARFFYGFRSAEDTSMDKFGTSLQDADPSFSMQSHKQHLSVFAGAELIAVIERDEHESLADLAALCLVCGAAQGMRGVIPIPMMPQIAARYIESRTSKRALAKVASDEAEDDLKIENLERELRIVGEETNMLWWLISECSRDRNESWKALRLPATSIIAGKELADLTRVIPGPVAAAAFLDRVVRHSSSAKPPKFIKVMDAVERTPREWREQYPFKPGGLIDLMPISNGIKLSVTVSDGNDWSPVFEKGTAMPANSTIAPGVLAYQVFLERLLARLPEEIG
jgi:hypothetical protein